MEGLLASKGSIVATVKLAAPWAASLPSLSCKVRLESHSAFRTCQQLICALAGPALADSLHNSAAEWLKSIGQEEHIAGFEAAGFTNLATVAGFEGQGLSKKELAEIALFSTQGMSSTDQKALQAASQRLARQLSSIKPGSPATGSSGEAGGKPLSSHPLSAAEVESPLATGAVMKGSPPGGGIYMAAAAGLPAAGEAAEVNDWPAPVSNSVYGLSQTCCAGSGRSAAWPSRASLGLQHDMAAVLMPVTLCVRSPCGQPGLCQAHREAAPGGSSRGGSSSWKCSCAPACSMQSVE